MPCAVQVEYKEADRDVQELARDLVAVDLSGRGVSGGGRGEAGRGGGCSARGGLPAMRTCGGSE